MTDDLLTLNSSKTEFLLIGLKQQLAKIHNSSLNTTHSARNLGFIFDEHLTFSDQIFALSKSCYYHIRQLRCIRPYLDSKMANFVVRLVSHSMCAKIYTFSAVEGSLSCALNCSSRPVIAVPTEQRAVSISGIRWQSIVRLH